MLKHLLAISCLFLMSACGPKATDSQIIAKEFKLYHREKNIAGLLELFNGETLYPPYRKALKKVLAEEITYPIKTISLKPIDYSIPKGIYNIQPTQELVIEYDTNYQLSSVYLLGTLNGRPTLAWIRPPDTQNSVAPLVESTQSLENSNYEN